MNGNNMLDAMEFIDDELIMAAEPVPNKTAKIKDETTYSLPHPICYYS